MTSRRLLRVIGMMLAGLMVVMGSPAGKLDASQTNMWFLDDLETLLPGTFDGTGISVDGRISPTTSTRSVDLGSRMVWGLVEDGDGQIVATSLPSELVRIDAEGNKKTLLEGSGLGFTALVGTEYYVYAASSPGGEIYRYSRSSGSIEQLAKLDVDYIWELQPSASGDLYIGTGTSGQIFVYSGGTVREVTSVRGNNVMSLTMHRGTLHAGDDRGILYELQNQEVKSIYGFRNAEVNVLRSDGTSLYVGVNQRMAPSSEGENRQREALLTRQLEQRSMLSEQRNQARQSKKNSGDTEPRDETNGFQEHVEDAIEGDQPTAEDYEERRRREVLQPPESEHRPTVVPRSSDQEMPPRIQSRTEKPAELFAGLTGHAVYKFRKPQKLTILHSDQQQIVHDLLPVDGKLLVATGPEGRILELREDGRTAMHLDVDQNHILNLKGDEDGLRSFTTGEAGVLKRVTSFVSGKSTYRSPVLDAKFLSDWGNLEVHRSGSLEIRTRSGNTEEPGDDWSEWSNWHSSSSFEVQSPTARFFQVEVRFLDDDSILKRTEIPYQISNQAPRIIDLSIQPQPVHQMLQREFQHPMEALNRSRRSRGRFGSSELPLTTRNIQWNVQDPDGDPTVARLSYRSEQGSNWIPMHSEEFLRTQQFSWGVSDLAAGYYEVRIEVTDQPFNDPGKGYWDQRMLGPVLVDQGPPTIKNLRQTSGMIRFQARDEYSRIFQVQVRINAESWQTVRSVDGVFDSRTEQFRWKLPGDVKTDDLIQIRVMDESGNTASDHLLVN